MRTVGDLCGGFVLDADAGAVFVRLVTHSRERRPGNLVAPCAACGRLHEISPPVAPTA